MIRTVLTTNFGEEKLLYTVRITHGVACPEEGQEAFAALMHFMQDLCYSPDIIRHVGPSPQSIRIFHDEGGWVMEAVTVVPRKE